MTSLANAAAIAWAVLGAGIAPTPPMERAGVDGAGAGASAAWEAPLGGAPDLGVLAGASAGASAACEAPLGAPGLGALAGASAAAAAAAY
jgi:hypothetical protein